MAIRDLMADGTPLAADHAVTEPLPRALSAEVWRRNRDKFFLAESQNTSALTIKLGCLVQLAVIGLFVHAGYEAWRIAAITLLYVAFALSHHLFVKKARKHNRTVDSTFIGMNVAAQILVVGSAALTGGAHSPFIVSTLLPSIISLLFFGPHAVSRWMAAANGLLILAIFCLPGGVVGPSVTDPHFTIILLLGLVWHLFMLHLMVGKLTIVASRSGESYACLREERLTELDAQLHRLQSVGAKVAHELKNPLASIKGLCQLVARTPDSERTQERLAVVASEISRMETILNEYLSFSRPLEDLTPQSLDLKAVAQDVLDVLAGRADQAGVTLALDGAATPAHGDPRRLKEALINLVSNAIEATPNGGRVELRVRVPKVNGLPAENTVTLEVRDTGRGISPEDLERLGTSFFTTRPNGTGLGVVLAQGVIAQHGGQLRYLSTVGLGTTATITLPRTSAAIDPTTAPGVLTLPKTGRTISGART